MQAASERTVSRGRASGHTSITDWSKQGVYRAYSIGSPALCYLGPRNIKKGELTRYIHSAGVKSVKPLIVDTRRLLMRHTSLLPREPPAEKAGRGGCREGGPGRFMTVEGRG